MRAGLQKELLDRKPENAIWRGFLSSSAIATSVSVFALFSIDKEKYRKQIEQGAKWLRETMHPEGSWGDSPESPSNLTATLLSYAALYAVDSAPQAAGNYLKERFGGASDHHIIDGVLAYYGKDLTFSVPILVMCGLTGVIHSWDKIPNLPFELAVLPQKLFKHLQLPVVSYAIPALIAVGLLLHKKKKRNLTSPVRDLFIEKSLAVLIKLQPEHGGFLEAAPLTSFVSMCMAHAGLKSHPVTEKAASFLYNTVRDNGAWPIDTDLSCWVTALSVKALGDAVPDKKRLEQQIKANAFKTVHPFTGAQKGGWGWTDLAGSVPDADDTSGALVALYLLSDARYSVEIKEGIEWLLDLQNSDGGIPTFCKGWGKLPFDRSSPDITAHAILAIELWMDHLPEYLQQRCRKALVRMFNWLEKNQTSEGALIPLWFGDQQAKDERSPVYGTATTVEYLSCSTHATARRICEKGVMYLLNTQQADGGWGGNKHVSSKITLTAKALGAIASFDFRKPVIDSGLNYLYTRYQEGTFYQAEPIGLYFARLWYSEDLYNITFALNALTIIANKYDND